MSTEPQLMKASTMFKICSVAMVGAAIAMAGIVLGYHNQRWIVGVAVLTGVATLFYGGIANLVGLLNNDRKGRKE